MTVPRMLPMPLADTLREALDLGRLDELTWLEPRDRRDRFLVLHQVYDLHLSPLGELGDSVRFQHHPVIAGLKAALEQTWIDELDSHCAPSSAVSTPEDVREALIDIAVSDRLPAAYKWLSRDADWDQLVEFLAVEGGPDAGFDDLVALCQIGLSGAPKLELAKNYWDEMGNGSPEAVHTVLHDDLVAASQMPRIPREDLPVSALERSALCGLLATNRWLQPELVGALGMTELQAGPRCRLVVKALERLGAPAGTLPFYREHAEVDPRHGADWVSNAVMPLVEQDPAWGPRILRGAEWRAQTNLRFFAEVLETIRPALLAS